MKEKDESDLDEKDEKIEAEKLESRVEKKPEEEKKEDKEDKLDDAVDDIKTHDTDELLKTEEPKHHDFAVHKESRFKRFIHNKKVAIPTGLVVLILLLLIVPFTRYTILGVFLKQTYSLTVIDSQTGQPVSSASVTLAGKTTTTDNHGDAHIKTKVGHDSLVLSKKYYADLDAKILVPVKVHGTTTYKLQATGRQVPLTITDKINGNPVENATVTSAGTEAKTDKNGQVTIVLPPDKSTVAATISASGYNNNSVTLQVTSTPVKANNFELTPAGKIYFLSNLSGKIDVVKTNLDGTDRQTVRAGTGTEDPQNTVLLASTDWKYLALLVVTKTGANPELDLIDTSNDQISNIDEGNATFNLIGWDGDSFIYQVNRTDVQSWQPNSESIKSFNATTKKLITLDSTTVTDVVNQSSYAGEDFSTIIILNDKEIVYAKEWTDLVDVQGGLSATLNTIMPDGSAKKIIKNFGPVQNDYGYDSVDLSLVGYEPDGIYAYSNAYNENQVYKYEDGNIAPTSDVDGSTFYTKTYNYYQLSPSDKQAFWSEPRDGKNTLFVGDQNGDNGKQIASLSDYDVYGWYTDKYLLVFKNSSELYIMPATGGTPLKITDYYKPVERFNAYGGR